jgi:hypothetical protein
VGPRAGPDRKISPPTGIRTPDRPARSQSLYRMSYPAHTLLSNATIRKHSLWYLQYKENGTFFNAKIIKSILLARFRGLDHSMRSRALSTWCYLNAAL